MITSPQRSIYLANLLLENDGKRFRLLELKKEFLRGGEWARISGYTEQTSDFEDTAYLWREDRCKAVCCSCRLWNHLPSTNVNTGMSMRILWNVRVPACLIRMAGAYATYSTDRLKQPMATCAASDSWLHSTTV